jgi:hypothetical protein
MIISHFYYLHSSFGKFSHFELEHFSSRRRGRGSAGVELVARVVSLMGLGWSASWTRLKWALLCSAAPLARDANNHISRRRVDPMERKAALPSYPSSSVAVSGFPPPLFERTPPFDRTRDPIRQVRADFSSLPMHTVCI